MDKRYIGLILFFTAAAFAYEGGKFHFGELEADALRPYLEDKDKRTEENLAEAILMSFYQGNEDYQEQALLDAQNLLKEGIEAGRTLARLTDEARKNRIDVHIEGALQSSPDAFGFPSKMTHKLIQAFDGARSVPAGNKAFTVPAFQSDHQTPRETQNAMDEMTEGFYDYFGQNRNQKEMGEDEEPKMEPIQIPDVPKIDIEKLKRLLYPSPKKFRKISPKHEYRLEKIKSLEDLYQLPGGHIYPYKGKLKKSWYQEDEIRRLIEEFQKDTRRLERALERAKIESDQTK